MAAYAEDEFKTDDGLYTLFQEKRVDRDLSFKHNQDIETDAVDTEHEEKEGSLTFLLFLPTDITQ